MKAFLSVCFIFFASIGFCQSASDDSITFHSAIDWLQSKLDYVYYDDVSEKWWTNTFYINEDKVVTIKQISSKTRITANINAKNYTIRTFRIQDINPYTIDIKEIKEPTGRFVKGQLLEIRTFDGEPKIHKSINNRKATSTSYLHLSFPNSLTDSLTDYPSLVKKKFYEAIVSSTKIYSSNEKENYSLIMHTLKGHYHAENGEKWISNERFPGIIKFETEEKELFFGFDKGKNQYYLTTISENGIFTDFFNLKKGNQLELVSATNPDKTILFQSRNSFRLNGHWFYRQ